MDTGSTAGFPGVNTDINEWYTEATESFAPPIVEKNLLVRNLLIHGITEVPLDALFGVILEDQLKLSEAAASHVIIMSSYVFLPTKN